MPAVRTTRTGYAGRRTRPRTRAVRPTSDGPSSNLEHSRAMVPFERLPSEILARIAEYLLLKDCAVTVPSRFSQGIGNLDLAFGQINELCRKVYFKCLSLKQVFVHLACHRPPNSESNAMRQRAAYTYVNDATARNLVGNVKVHSKEYSKYDQLSIIRLDVEAEPPRRRCRTIQYNYVVLVDRMRILLLAEFLREHAHHDGHVGFAVDCKAVRGVHARNLAKRLQNDIPDLMKGFGLVTHNVALPGSKHHVRHFHTTRIADGALMA